MTSSSEFEAMQQLVPLYVNGSLSAHEKIRFEQELWRNRALRQECAEFQEIEAAFRAMEQEAFPDLDATLDTLTSRVTREARRFAAQRQAELEAHTVAQRLRAMLAMPRLAWALAGVQLAIIAGLVANPSLTADTARLQSLSESAGTHAARRFNVVFSDDASQAGMRALLQEMQARIVDGPTAVGLMTIEIRDEQVDTQMLLMKLRASKLVRFAEAAY
jgi:anti-sigma factor RsiW